jgi:hypothetical protein
MYGDALSSWYYTAQGRIVSGTGHLLLTCPEEGCIESYQGTSAAALRVTLVAAPAPDVSALFS